MSLHYLAKLQIRVFCKNSNAQKRNSRILLIDFYFTYLKRCNFFDFDIALWQINQENMYQTLSESASFRKGYDKTFYVIFRLQF